MKFNLNSILNKKGNSLIDEKDILINKQINNK